MQTNQNKSNNQNQKKFIITKKIAKHGSQSIIVIPRILQSHLKPGTIAEVTINILDVNVNELNVLEEKNEN